MRFSCCRKNQCGAKGFDMTDEKLHLLKYLISIIPELTSGQLHWMQRVADIILAEHNYVLSRSGFFDDTTLQNLNTNGVDQIN